MDDATRQRIEDLLAVGHRVVPEPYEVIGYWESPNDDAEVIEALERIAGRLLGLATRASALAVEVRECRGRTP